MLLILLAVECLRLVQHQLELELYLEHEGGLILEIGQVYHYDWLLVIALMRNNKHYTAKRLRDKVTYYLAEIPARNSSPSFHTRCTTRSSIIFQRFHTFHCRRKRKVGS